MHASPHTDPSSPADSRQTILDVIAHLDHVLPGQAPILNFVHHNTLHGYQHLPFPEALAAAEKITGIRGYLPDGVFRGFHARGRILDEDLDAVFAENADLDGDQVLIDRETVRVTRREVHRIALVHGIEGLSNSQLNWQIEELAALERFQDDVSPAARHRLLEAAKHAAPGENGAPQQWLIRDLWSACLANLGLEHYALHPEELTDLSMRQAESLLARFHGGHADGSSSPVAHARMRADAQARLEHLFEQVGDDLTLRGLVLALTGQDALDVVRPALIRFCGSHLDEGLAAWHAPRRGDGMLAAWRELADEDLAFTFAAGGGATKGSAMDAAETILTELQRLGIPPERFPGYLQRLALELPGWSGLVNWRDQRPGYEANRHAPVSLADYLALRLVMDRVVLERLCREIWGVPATLGALRGYLQRNLSELLVRCSLYQGQLPEYLSSRAEELIGTTGSERGDVRDRWRGLADMIFTWQHSPAAETSARHTPGRSAWRLFRLAQHLGLSGSDLRALPRPDCETLLTALDELTPARRGYLWLCAYERRYREEIFRALAANRGRGRWARRDQRPEAQIIFCMDDREESIRRHLEELNPAIETLGAAGFFGVPINWKGLDDTAVTPLCPIVVTPVNEVREVPRPDALGPMQRHAWGRRLRQGFARWFNQEIRRNLVRSMLLIGGSAPLLLPALFAKVFFPARQEGAVRHFNRALVTEVPTELVINAADDRPATPEQPRLGFTDQEQADRVAAFLRNTGLTYGFGPLVALMGHGSMSQNNPHLAAYDCGACSGRHGGPNARTFAAMANRPVVRALLSERGITVPDDTWFLGAEHNTCDEEILWFDLEDMPGALRPCYKRLVDQLDQARHHSAHERCRRLASAPRDPALPEALAHIAERATDFSQARPELGHATNAAAFIGRRSISQGAFFDRRAFLISYDPTQDADGRILEGILLAVGPVGAGINLEYYFSTVDNDRYGCGTKVPHNVTGLFAVMEGAASDLRTGLPRQMIEIHEAMRLLVVVEHTPEILGAIYERQLPLRELIGNGWIQVASLHPETGVIARFLPDQGFVPWEEGSAGSLEVVERSADWYSGYSEPRPPALIRQPTFPAAARAGDHA